MKQFKKIYIEITNKCNLNCPFCIKNTREEHTLTIEQFKHIINNIKPFTDYIYLHVLGEPLLNENLEEFLKIASNNNIYVNITTNGSLLNLKKDILLNNDVRQINISLQSLLNYNELQRKIHLQEIFSFVHQIINKDKTLVSLRLWMDNKVISKDIEQQIIQEFKNNKKIFISYDEEFIWPSINNEIITNKGKCYGGKHQLAILVDGTVSTCCLDSLGEINLGNIYTQSLEQILQNKRYQQFISNLKNNKLIEPLCQRCSYHQRFERKKNER